MTPPRWDAAAARVLREAEALFAAADLRWFERSSELGIADPWPAFDGLIRAALAKGEGDLLPTESALPAMTPTEVRPPQPMRRHESIPSGGARQPVRPASLPGPARLPALPTASRPATSSPAIAATRSEPPATRPAVGRAARVAAPTAHPGGGPNHIAQGTWKTTSALATREPVESVATPTPLPEAPVPPLSEADFAPLSKPEPLGSELGARRGVLDAPRSPASTESVSAQSRRSLHAVDRPAPVGPALARTRVPLADPRRPTRLVDGLPALRNLFQAVVADSRERQTLATVDHAPAPPSLAAVPPTSAPLVAVPPLRALPGLDEAAEDMLVDRLTDRLQERLREQALRHFGFTGGLS